MGPLFIQSIQSQPYIHDPCSLIGSLRWTLLPSRLCSSVETPCPHYNRALPFTWHRLPTGIASNGLLLPRRRLLEKTTFCSSTHVVNTNVEVLVPCPKARANAQTMRQDLPCRNQKNTNLARWTRIPTGMVMKRQVVANTRGKNT